MVNNYINPQAFKLISLNEYYLIYCIHSSQVFKIRKDSTLFNYFDSLVSNKLEKFDPLIKQMIEKELKEKIRIDDLKNETVDISEIDAPFQTVILPIAGKCNLKCSYCFAQTEERFGFQNFGEKEGTQIIDFIMSNSNPDQNCLISFFGGEPLLRFDIMKKLVNYIKEKYKSRQISYSVTTNGTIMNDRIASFLKKNNINCLISLDGSKEKSKNRIFKNGRETYDIVIKNIEYLRDKGVAMAIRSTIPSNSDSITEVYDFLEKLNLPFAAVRAYQSINQTNLADYVNRQNSFRNQYENLLNFYIRKIKSKERIYCYSLLEDLKRIDIQDKRMISCSAGMGIFSITNTGDIFTCEHLAYDSNLSVGNIKTGIEKEKLTKMRPLNVDTINRCKECWVRYLCSGGCFTEKRTVKNEISIKANCDIVKIYWEFILKLYNQMKESDYSF
jgi:radical SAM protein with 4Fe4S-binding SPASM domain